MLKLFFFLSAVLCVYSYFLYPLILKLIPPRHKPLIHDVDEQSLPSLTLIIAVHNEEGRIAKKLENSLEIDYPGDRFEIIVASDSSSDNTESIVATFAKQGVRLVRADQRKGKEYAQLCGMEKSGSDIIVFSDVATEIPRDALRLMVREFQDPNVGAVSSEDRFISKDEMLVGEGAYVKYEMWLRNMESDRGGLVGLSGSFFSARREVCKCWDIETGSDFNVARNCAQLDLLAVNCPEVAGYYPDLADPKAEYLRKVRTVLRGISAIPRHSWVLNPFRRGLFAFEIWSHKIMRWGVPWFMLLFLLLTLSLQGQGAIYTEALIAQIVFYALALAGWLSEQMQAYTPIRIISFFVQSNIAIGHACVLFLMGRRMVTWTPSKR